MYTNFEDLIVWQRSISLAEDVIDFLSDTFPNYSKLGDQMIGSAVSIPSNIAEGSERGTKRDFKRFLDIAKGSNAELRTQLILSKRFLKNKYDAPIETMILSTREVDRLLHGLQKSLLRDLKLNS